MPDGSHPRGAHFVEVIDGIQRENRFKDASFFLVRLREEEIEGLLPVHLIAITSQRFRHDDGDTATGIAERLAKFLSAGVVSRLPLDEQARRAPVAHAAVRIS